MCPPLAKLRCVIDFPSSSLKNSIMFFRKTSSLAFLSTICLWSFWHSARRYLFRHFDVRFSSSSSSSSGVAAFFGAGTSASALVTASQALDSLSMPDTSRY